LEGKEEDGDSSTAKAKVKQALSQKQRAKGLKEWVKWHSFF
jgi:hypothetical protein